MKQLISSPKHVGLETNGKSLGIDYEDDVFGALTLNVG